MPYWQSPTRGRDIEYESSPQQEDECPRWTPPTSGYSILNQDQPPTIVRPAQATTQATCKQVRMKEEPEASPPKKEPECSFCREETHSYQTCPRLRQMVIEQANELTRRRVAEYEKSQEEAIRHTIQEEYGPATSVLDPMATRSSAATLLHPQEGRAGRGGTDS